HNPWSRSPPAAHTHLPSFPTLRSSYLQRRTQAQGPGIGGDPLLLYVFRKALFKLPLPRHLVLGKSRDPMGGLGLRLNRHHGQTKEGNNRENRQPTKGTPPKTDHS